MLRVWKRYVKVPSVKRTTAGCGSLWYPMTPNRDQRATVMKHPDYGKWIEQALARNPKLSKAGLSRHMGHGSDRARVIKMVDGSRKITAQELVEIAAYLGVPPPGQDDLGTRVPIVGVIDPGVWLEQGVSRVDTDIMIPPRLDRRYPAAKQVAYQMAVDVPRAMLAKGDFLLAIPKTTTADVEPGDYMVVSRERAGLRQFGLAQAEYVKSGVRLRSVTNPDSDDELTPVAIVIAVFRPVG